VYRRKAELGVYRSGLGRKPPRRVWYSSSDDNERATAIGILDILLKHNPNLDGRQFSRRGSQFPTPLHCAASSGWLSHAQALVEAGAPVYTGPTCSPLCWAKGGSGGSEPVAIYLREKLGECGLAMIKADHERDRGAASQPVVPRPRGLLLEEEEAPRISTGIPRPSTEATLTTERDFLAQQTRKETIHYLSLR
jgi:hypothetical protein